VALKKTWKSPNFFLLLSGHPVFFSLDVLMSGLGLGLVPNWPR